MNKKIYITTPIFYTNGNPHLGHIHTCCLGDFFSKAFKNFNYEVFFLTGTDEHGQKIANAAKTLNIPPQELVNKTSQVFKTLFEDYNINYDYFIRTTDENHKKNILEVWEILLKNNYLYKGVYKGLYAEKDECFYSPEETYVDKDNQRRATISNSEVVEVEEECYFFRLSAFKEKLLNFYETHEFTIPNNLKEELIKYTENLKDLCVSRNISWGIKIPNTNQTIYVWIDALFNYITAIGAIENYNKDLWANSLHIIGKDIIIFHGVYWPALLMAVGLQPPKHLFIHGWWLFNDSKMSKSLGNIIDPSKIKHKEYLRYFCLRQELLGHDGNFDKKHFIEIINNELIGKMLNLFYRFFSLINKNYGFNNIIEIDDFNKREDLILIKKQCLQHLEKFSSKHYINELINISNIANEYIDKNKIWQDFNLKHINYLVPLLDLLSTLLKGVLEETYNKIKNLYTLKTNNNKYEFSLLKLEPLFTKIENEEDI